MMPTLPYSLSKTQVRPVRYSPLFGEHSAEVLQADANVGVERYAELEADGITGSGFLGLKETTQMTNKAKL